MIEKHEISALMKSVGGVVKQYVSGAVGDITQRLDGMDARLNAIPAGPKGKDGDPGRDGSDGKDADPEIIKAEVGRAVALLPASRDGKDADPALVYSAVAQQFEALASAFVEALADER